MTQNQTDNRRTRKPARKPREQRVGFSVKEQLLGKHGPGGYGQLLQKLREIAPEEEAA